MVVEAPAELTAAQSRMTGGIGEGGVRLSELGYRSKDSPVGAGGAGEAGDYCLGQDGPAGRRGRRLG